MRRLLLVAALLLASCSWPEESAQIFVHVAGIPAQADHLDVTLTPGDPSVAAKTYRPSFQPGSLNPPELDLAFTQPATTGTFTLQINAADRNQQQLATGTVSGTLPGPVNLELTLQ